MSLCNGIVFLGDLTQSPPLQFVCLTELNCTDVIYQLDLMRICLWCRRRKPF